MCRARFLTIFITTSVSIPWSVGLFVTISEIDIVTQGLTAREIVIKERWASRTIFQLQMTQWHKSQAINVTITSCGSSVDTDAVYLRDISWTLYLIEPLNKCSAAQLYIQVSELQRLDSKNFFSYFSSAWTHSFVIISSITRRCATWRCWKYPGCNSCLTSSQWRRTRCAVTERLDSCKHSESSRLAAMVTDGWCHQPLSWRYLSTTS